MGGNYIQIIQSEQKTPIYRFRGVKPNGTKNNAKHSPTSQSADSGDGVLHF